MNISRTLISALAAATILSAAMPLHASEIRHQFINPSFGGNPLYGSYLLSNADRQNGHEEPTTDRSNGQSFSSTITSSLLNRIAFNIADQIYGENAQTSGRFVIDDTLLEFNRVNNQVVVEITNSTTGETTTIELPVTEF